MIINLLDSACLQFEAVTNHDYSITVVTFSIRYTFWDDCIICVFLPPML